MIVQVGELGYTWVQGRKQDKEVAGKDKDDAPAMKTKAGFEENPLREPAGKNDE